MTYYKHFKHLHVPDHWEQYWSKYPQGYTIMEALISWVSQVDHMVDNVNDWNAWLEPFVETFDTKLQDTVRVVIQELYDSGQLAELTAQVIDVVQDQINDLDDRLTTELAETVSELPNAIGYFGAVGDGIADDTQALQALLDYSSDGSKPVVIPGKTFRTTQPLTAHGGVRVHSFNATIEADHDGVVLYSAGGANYNDFYGTLNVTRSGNFVYERGQTPVHTNAHGVIIQGRTRIEKMFSTNHHGHGFDFRATSNLNKSEFNMLYGTANGGNGFHFEGTQDDSSVWQINLFAQYNYEEGIRAEDDYSGRNWVGFWYAETNGENGTASEVYLGKLRHSNLSIYAENRSSSPEIELGENTTNLSVRSFRNNYDKDEGSNNSILRGNSKYLSIGQWSDGLNAGSDVKPFKSDDIRTLAGRSDRSVDYDYSTRDKGIVDRIIGDGRKQSLFFDLVSKKGLSKTIREGYVTTIDSNDVIHEYSKSNGTIDVPENVEIGDVIKKDRFGGMRGGYSRFGLEIEYVVSNVSSGFVSVDCVIYTLDLNYQTERTEKARIKANGDVVISGLSGTGNRALMVDENGRLFAE